MKIVKLKKDNLFPFLEGIRGDSQLWAPVKKDSKHSFQPVKDLSQIDLDYTRTILPPRKILLPAKFKMYQASKTKFTSDFSHISKKTIFGMHPCDIHAFLTMDKFYSHEIEDPYWLEARKNLVLLGHSCWPDENCMCKSTNTHMVSEGYDLFFTDLGDYYMVWIGSSTGDDLIRKMPHLFDENLNEDDVIKYNQNKDARDKAFTSKINFAAMPDLMELRYTDAIWEKLGNACLACGSCTNVCPTCSCYNVQDRPVLGKGYSNIQRCWDACTLENYSGVAGGENFREKRADRLKLWYTHKLHAYISKYGKPSCVGCGRCVSTCPVDINVRTVAQSLDGNEVDSFWNRLSKEVTK